jgi:hypothetical protein
MPHNVYIIPAKEFLRADYRGELDLAASQRLLVDLAMTCADTPDRNILIDVRGADTPVLTASNLFDLVQTLRSLGLGVTNRIAILREPRDTFDRARFFEMLATDRGLKVGAFEDFEAAFGWLFEIRK